MITVINGLTSFIIINLNNFARMAQAQTTEAKKEEFRNYLERAGIIDQLTKVLVGLYEEPEKPGNAVDFIKKSLGAPSDTDVEELRAENEELRRTTAQLER